MTPWEIHGVELGNCNCVYACPCQFSAPPTDNKCEAVDAYEVHRGHYGDVSLDGLRMAVVYKWPGPVHEGNGTMQVIIDEGASQAQRMALTAIMHGEDTEEAATMWWVFAAMSPDKLEPLTRKIDFEVDIPARRGRISVPGLIETVAEPIRNPVTGAEHRVRIDLPNGFEFTIAEIASGTTKTSGAIVLDLKDSYTQMCELHLSNTGVIREAA